MDKMVSDFEMSVQIDQNLQPNCQTSWHEGGNFHLGRSKGRGLGGDG